MSRSRQDNYLCIINMQHATFYDIQWGQETQFLVQSEVRELPFGVAGRTKCPLVMQF